jgi:t-SNARE complex subunit (syntaxin)
MTDDGDDECASGANCFISPRLNICVVIIIIVIIIIVIIIVVSSLIF